MSVEKRYSKRFPMDGEVYIRYRKQRAFPAKAQDCSLYGMCLRTENLTLLTGAMVELDIFHNGRNWQIVGLVSHTRKHGLGVMFWEPQAEFYESVVSAAASLGTEQRRDGVEIPALLDPSAESQPIPN